MGARLIAVRPTLGDYVLEMPRGAQVIYPKDLGPILILADIFPGARVLESGVGSGALTMTLLRAVGPTGHVLGYELRDDFAAAAQRNVEDMLGPDIPLDVEVRDVYDGIDVDGLDRIVLDLPEPWRVVTARGEGAAARAGSCSRTCRRSSRSRGLREALDDSPFGMAQTLEVLQRTWHVDGQSVRPDHRMVAHTGFLTHARLLRRPSERLRRAAASRSWRWPRAAGGVSASIRGVLAWVGLAVGLVVGVVFVDDVTNVFKNATPERPVPRSRWRSSCSSW